MQLIVKISSSGHRLNQKMLKHIESFITSCLNVIILHNGRHRMFWTLLKLCVCLSKLPRGARDKWSRRILLISRKQGKEPEPADFIDFVNDGNLIVSDLVFSKESVEQYIDKKTKPRRVATYVS